MRLVVALFAFLVLAFPSVAQTPSAPDDDPDNVLIIQLKDGPVVIRMRPDLAPNHVKRIKELVRQGFYNGVKWHRVIPGTLAQTGDPLGTGAGGSGVKLKAEISAESHVRGTVSMARAQDMDSADSQWFICLKALPDFNRLYTIWGKVIRGMEYVNHIETGDPDSGHVSEPDRIISARIESDPPKPEAAADAPAGTSAPGAKKPKAAAH
ncbi:MAG TPA: peptidylprolyl isomerase [Alphaproteobacteria bacterium]|nr:peptidylprolyl isomerase [Alphaproteobacteria bacterium]